MTQVPILCQKGPYALPEKLATRIRPRANTPSSPFVRAAISPTFVTGSGAGIRNIRLTPKP